MEGSWVSNNSSRTRLDIPIWGFYSEATVIGDWCNGSTNASGAFCLGSNPRSPVFPLFFILLIAFCHGPSVAAPPAVWDLAKAQREATATRERVCINGLWRWQPGKGEA